MVYGVLAFANLGSTAAPQTGWVSTSPDEQIVFDLGESTRFSLLYYAGVSYNDFSVSTSDDGVTWSSGNALPHARGPVLPLALRAPVHAERRPEVTT